MFGRTSVFAFFPRGAGVGGGGRTHMLLALSDLTIDHASLSRRSTVPTPKRDTSDVGRSAVVFHIPVLITNFFCSSCLLPRCVRAGGGVGILFWWAHCVCSSNFVFYFCPGESACASRLVLPPTIRRALTSSLDKQSSWAVAASYFFV